MGALNGGIWIVAAASLKAAHPDKEIKLTPNNNDTGTIRENTTVAELVVMSTTQYQIWNQTGLMTNITEATAVAADREKTSISNTASIDIEPPATPASTRVSTVRPPSNSDTIRIPRTSVRLPTPAPPSPLRLRPAVP